MKENAPKNPAVPPTRPSLTCSALALANESLDVGPTRAADCLAAWRRRGRLGQKPEARCQKPGAKSQMPGQTFSRGCPLSGRRSFAICFPSSSLTLDRGRERATTRAGGKANRPDRRDQIHMPLWPECVGCVSVRARGWRTRPRVAQAERTKATWLGGICCRERPFGCADADGESSSSRDWTGATSALSRELVYCKVGLRKVFGRRVARPRQTRSLAGRSRCSLMPARPN